VGATTDSTRALRARVEPTRALFVSSYSFTALIARQSATQVEDDAAADEARAAAATVESEGVDTPSSSDTAAAPHAKLLALAPLRGTEFGNAVHAVFERRVIGEPLANQRGLIERCLREFAVRSEALPREAAIDVVAERVEATLAAEILPGLRLRDVPPARQRAEMAFHFVLDGVSMDALRAACVRHSAAGVWPPQLGHGTLRGLMSGKIDLVFEHRGRFHVLDYKSNWLGDRLAAYTGPALDSAMDAHAYRLQALLYSVAVQRYLRQRLQYDASKHLGEAIYLFVRATQLAPTAGVWQQRFDPALLDAVDRSLGGALRPEAA
jgi:exodeoxyribonuclease V beta subunit